MHSKKFLNIVFFSSIFSQNTFSIKNLFQKGQCLTAIQAFGFERHGLLLNVNTHGEDALTKAEFEFNHRMLRSLLLRLLAYFSTLVYAN